MVALVTLLLFFGTLRSSTIFAKRSILDIWRGFQYASESIGPKSFSFIRSRDEWVTFSRIPRKLNRSNGFCRATVLKNPKIFRSSRPEVFCGKGVLRNFAKFTGKRPCQSLFFNKKVLSYGFYEISKNITFT